MSRGGVWWEHDVDVKAARRKVEAFSDDYFALLRKIPALGRWLTLGSVVLRAGDEIVEISAPK